MALDAGQGLIHQETEEVGGGPREVRATSNPQDEHLLMLELKRAPVTFARCM